MRGGAMGGGGGGFGGERIVSGEPCLTPIRVKGNDKTILDDARQGNLTQMKKRMRNSIFKKSEDINQQDERHCTPMHYAAKNSDIEMMRFIIEKGGDITAKDKHGWSPLQYAVRYAKAGAVEFLIQAGSDIQHREKKGWTSLHLAARNGQPEKARILLENSANVNDIQDQGWNSLHLAVRYGQPDTISTLLEYGIDINAHNRGWTALHLAALNGHTDIASILLNKSASTMLSNQDGKTALDIAREEKHERIVAIILEYEFQANTPQPVLPTPPPTPPSAPPFEIDPALRSHTSDLLQWRERIKSEVDQCSLDNSRDSIDSEESPDDSLGPQIAWKSLEEETKELLAQLEHLRAKETNQIKGKMKQIKSNHKRKLEQLDEQKSLLAAKIQEQEQSIPRLQEDFQSFEGNQLEAMGDIDILLANALAETEIIEALKNNQMENRFSACAPTKVLLVEDLLGFDSWAENEPAGNENQNCVAALANNTYFWKEDDCDLRYRPLCFGPELVNPCAEGLTYIAAADMCILLGGVGTMSWQQGQNYCKNSGGRLIEVYDEGIENAVRSSILSNGIFEQGLWMGLQDFANEGEFIWDDSGLKADYFDWDGIQPDSGTIGNCVVFYGSEYKWYDTDCSQIFAFGPLCEYEPLLK